MPYSYIAPMQTETIDTSFLELLRTEFKSRLRKNPQYSLRSFARDLKMNDSSLSQVLRGRRSITRKMKLSLIEALGMSPDEVYKIESQTPDPKFRQLNEDTFHILSDWYHDAILELTSLENFESDAQWISTKLGVSKTIINLALERLKRAGLIKLDRTGKLKNALGDSSNILDSEFTSTALRNYQEELMDLSKASLWRDSKSSRDHTSLLFACNKDFVPKMKNEITQFRRRIARLAQEQEKPLSLVYVLQLALFPVSDNLKDKNTLKE